MIRWAFSNVAKPVHLGARRVFSTAVDRRLGIVTTDETVADATGVDRALYLTTHRALAWVGVARVFRRLGVQPDDVLLDIGCGAGRVACFGARTRMKRVIGIELAPAFARLARQNAGSVRGRRAELVIAEADATQFAVPDDVTIVFFFNPFQGEVMRAAIKLILESVDREPRRVRFVYGNPVEHSLLVELQRFRLENRLCLGWRPSEEWKRNQMVHIYEIEPRAPEGGPGVPTRAPCESATAGA